jgi:hypothetical protein
MKYNYFKRMNGDKIIQVWLEIITKDGIRLLPYNCESKYFGEGLKQNELIPISLKDFRDIGWLFGCFNSSEKEIKELIEEYN